MASCRHLPPPEEAAGPKGGYGKPKDPAHNPESTGGGRGQVIDHPPPWSVRNNEGDQHDHGYDHQEENRDNVTHLHSPGTLASRHQAVCAPVLGAQLSRALRTKPFVNRCRRKQLRAVPTSCP